MATFKTDWASVEYRDDEETRKMLFDKVIAFFKEHGTFTGESIQQSDGPLVAAPELLSDLADNVLQFRIFDYT